MKLQKIMLDGGFSCPNRDGHVGTGGCTFCRTDAFNPSYCRSTDSIQEQIFAGKRFFAGKYSNMKYLAYFQAYSGTYAPLELLHQRYEEALSVEDVVGLVIGTRPDCIADDTLQYLGELQNQGYLISLELGVESFYDRTLLRVNRCHTAQDSISAIQRCAKADIYTTIHLILGLPGETREDILAETDITNQLPINAIKLHQLQILKGTPMAIEYATHPEEFLAMNIDDYVELAATFISLLRKDIHLERFAASAPSELIISPRWGLKPSEVQLRIEEKLTQIMA